MRATIVRAEERGKADYGWLQANYTFSFAQYFNPNRIQFGPLRVLNDDTIARGMGFGEHPHDNMEIVTIPLQGSLKHRDSISNEWIPLYTDEVQVMSAGTGIRHSEMNNSTSESLSLFQVWIFPDQQDLIPRYDQKWFDPAQRSGTLQVLVSDSRSPVEGSLTVHQDVQFSRIELSASETFNYELKGPGRGVFLMVITGAVIIDGQTLHSRDAMEISETGAVDLKATAETDLLWIEVALG